MKFFTFLILAAIFPLAALAQLHVIQVNGAIKFNDKDYVRVGDSIGKESRLSYPGRHDFIKVINEQGQISILTAPAPSESIELVKGTFSQYLSAFKEVLVQPVVNDAIKHSQMVYDELSVNKPMVVKNIVADTVTIKPFAVIEDSNKYLIDTNKFPLKGGKFLLQGKAGHKLQMLQRIQAKKDTVKVMYSDFLIVGRQTPDQTYNLLYQRDGSNMYEVVKNIAPYFDITGNVRAMTYQLIKYRKPQIDSVSLYQEAFGEVSTSFGIPSEIDFKKMFQSDYQYVFHPLIQQQPPRRTKTSTRIDAQKVPIALIRQQLAKFVEDPKGLPVSLRQFAPTAGDQGQTNSCTAWATVYGAYSVAYNRINQPKLVKFSPEYVYSGINSRYNICTDDPPGIFIFEALNFMHKYGDLPKYTTGPDCPAPYTPKQKQDAKADTIASAHPLFTYTEAKLTDTDIMAIKQAIAVQQKPVIVTLFLPSERDALNSFECLGDVHHDCLWLPTQDESDRLNREDTLHAISHSMVIVGYCPKLKNGCFEILNSYGNGWGDGGYMYVPYDVFKQWGVAGYVIDNANDITVAFAKLKGNILNNMSAAFHAPSAPHRNRPNASN